MKSNIFNLGVDAVFELINKRSKASVLEKN